ncbi:LLM class flavin-dependent oxidoreductase [Shimia sagamensis]|uniref:Luciferase family oxidoreductase, group 1 n=1 Tax=Shimia sagamensis TaxID=1566352 RepID=A0ABY1NM08_9RHOB|nr:LLM class flavin-dependent oxidoreductase [Shimia sagamensis]SMP12798.1 luciferase family oxidoreductase, group 1 [Shimia sagamensis]
MIPYSLLDLSPVPQGATAADALRNSLDLAQHAERWGYTRYWIAEHHNMPGIASSATAVLIGQILAATQTMRVGAGGIMLPNHPPLIVAEQFGTLASLYPDRVDLGLGRAPGTDMKTASALRRGLAGADHFPQDVVDLIGLFQTSERGQTVRAIPGEGTNVPIWILGSSLFGAQLAAQLGLPYAFASHFAPDSLEEAADLYRHRFTVGKTPKPHFMIAVNVFVAETEAEARRLRTSPQQGFLNLRKGIPGPLPTPVDRFEDVATDAEARLVNHALRVTAVGTKAMVKEQIRALIDSHQPDEIMLTGMIHDHTARLKSFGLAAEIVQELEA